MLSKCPHTATQVSRARRSPLQGALVMLTLVLCLIAAPASATPLSSKRQQASDAKAAVAASQAKVAAAAKRYADGEARLAAIRQASAANSAQLDVLMTRQRKLQSELDMRAGDLYRRGPTAFIEVLAGSSSFDAFTKLWETLTQISQQDAEMVAELKVTRAKAVQTAKALSAQQSKASAQLRELDAERSRARSELAGNRADYAAYQRQIAALEAAQAPKPVQGIVQAKNGGGSSAPSDGGDPSNPAQGQHGSGGWSRALCSTFGIGDGLVGSGMAGGGTLHADSMVVAHRTLPFGTLIEFEYHGNTGVAEVRDRGPYSGGREFDLGPGIARVLGVDGVATVSYRIIGR